MKAVVTIMLILFAPMVYAAGTSVTYTSNGKTYEGYYVSPSSSAPLVILVHDWDGLTDYEIRRSQMLAKMGYAVFAVDMFGKGIRPTEITHRRALTGNLYKNRQEMRQLLYDGLSAARLKGADTNRAIIAGYCFGGAVVLELARAGADLKGFVTFHGGLATPKGQNYSQTKGKVMVFHGTADTAIPMSQFAQLAAELESAGIAHEMVTYSGAPHAFTVFGSSRYREEADMKSWKRFAEFLDETLR